MPIEGWIHRRNAELFYREIGRGPPVLVLHGGPDFDHRYLLPEMDRLSDSFRLVYYDQRGRGCSADGVRTEDVTLGSEIADLEGVREHLGLESVALLGHSFGALLALEYALRHPGRVSHLILMNPGPVSHDDFLLLRAERIERWPTDVEQLKTMASTPEYQAGHPDAVAEYYRLHFRRTIQRPEHFDRLIERLHASFTTEGILKARRIEERLLAETWLATDYHLPTQLEALGIPTLILRGDADFIPEACSTSIARAIPTARLLTLKDCGHFSYLERPAEVREAIEDFFARTAASRTD